MELFPVLTTFYSAIKEDARIGASHISVYMALFQQWNEGGGINPIKIERGVIMKASKISARFTYNKCMNELQEFGYIIYKPTTNQFDRSFVTLKKLSK